MLKTTTYTDARIGLRIRARRRSLGFSQTELARALTISFQQVQKYEAGQNGIGAARLREIADFLGVKIDYFFEEAGTGQSGEKHDAADSLKHFIATQDGLELNRSFARIEDPAVRKAVLDLLKAASHMK